MDSRTLKICKVKLIGWLFHGSYFLNMGETLVCFQSVGACLRLILLLKLFLIALKCNHKCPTEVLSKYCQIQMIYSISVFIGILGQVWYLIVSIRDLCPYSYFSNLFLGDIDVCKFFSRISFEFDV